MNQYLAANRVEFAVTYLCNSKCRHCQRGDEEEIKRFPNHVDKSLAVDIVRKVGSKYRPASLMTFGGEPLLYPEVVYAVHEEAREVGIPVRDLITNGYWSRKTAKTQEIARNLVKCGVNEVALSVDGFHQEFVPLETVREAAEALLEAGMSDVHWNPCWVKSKDHDNAFNRKTKAVLHSLRDLRIRTGEGNVVRPEGRALVSLKNYLPSKTPVPKEKCGEIPYTEKLDSVKTVLVEPDGSVAVCTEFYIGNAFETDIIDILESYDPFKIPEARALIENGIQGLVDWARKKGVEPDPEGYYNVCRMCTDIRRKVEHLSPEQNARQRSRYINEKTGVPETIQF
jgi:MoaA/NifB/PqqE/SkfB family radical SAM enzyme